MIKIRPNELLLVVITNIVVAIIQLLKRGNENQGTVDQAHVCNILIHQ